MLTFGPYEHESGYNFGGNGTEQWIPSDNAELTGLPELCASGIGRIFPDLDVSRQVEFRLYAHRPRGEAVHQVDVILDDGYNIIFHILDEDEDELEEISIPDLVTDAVLEELGLSWDDVVEIEDEDELENTYTAWIRAVELDEIVPDIQDISIDDWDKHSVSLIIEGGKGFYAYLSVPLSDINWEH